MGLTSLPFLCWVEGLAFLRVQPAHLSRLSGGEVIEQQRANSSAGHMLSRSQDGAGGGHSTMKNAQ